MGDAIFVTLHNTSNQALIENRCAGDLEHWNGLEWESEIGRACVLEAPVARRVIEPGEVVHDTFETPQTLPFGEYRVIYEIDDSDGVLLPEPERSSNHFEMGG